jgi:PAS domain S-box-containing protein
LESNNGNTKEANAAEGATFARAYLDAILESSHDAIISKNLDGIVQTWNPAATRIFGYSEEEAIGMPISRLLPPDLVHEEEMILAKMRRGIKVEPFETRRLTKLGEYLDVSITVSPILDENGTIVGAANIAQDVRDRLAVEAHRARLAAIVESSDDAIVSKDLNGIVQSWNSGAERIFGYMAEEIIGKSILMLLPPDRLDEETRILSRLRRGDRIDHFETIRKRKDGRLIDVSVTISPIRNAHGKIIGASKVARDISERKMLEATMSRLREELELRVQERTAALEAANREMEAFTYSIAHDLRAPLRAIGSTSAMIKEDYGPGLPPDAVILLNRQMTAAKRLAQLVDDLLQYSRLGRSTLEPVPLDITQLANEVITEAKEARPECTFTVQPSLQAMGDRNLIKLLLQNLIDNACKFSGPGGLVEIGQRGNSLYVEDHGRGFDMAYAEKIFRPFERLVNNEEIEGTGIGLAHVKRIIERHGGTIWVNSIVGEGTTFFFTLP